ncbi:diguanylate cyclase (GGDEF)-like protein [Acidovorax soli]|uniref:Diguanylate cyclase (GGDEF)-like protein n=1 Tax=Acidovorax soli TaxID=592050 RepID=A0A7X0UD22_9BURK|nr:EAL domain-containing protein [Acidovorax soli]MBB6563609.1 diguanylate cyclase (GGDEF)-like protein [Acidovorax soli]
MATVLVADDEPVNRELVVTLLKYAGHQALEAIDGAQALDCVLLYRPDLVICDILMPTMDGYEFARRLREDTRVQAIQVIFYSATFLEHEARVLAAACGVHTVLAKPCEPELILQTVERALAPGGLDQRVAGHGASFEREHVQLISDKLIEKVAELEQANVRLQGLSRLSLGLSFARDPQQLLETFCRGVQDLFAAQAAITAVLRVGDKGMDWCATGLPGDEPPGLRPAVAEALAGMARQGNGSAPATRRIDLDPPAGVDGGTGGSGCAPLAQALRACLPQARWALLVPIAAHSACDGCVVLLGAREGELPPGGSEAQALEAQAAHFGRVFENIRLYAQEQDQLAQLRAQERERECTEALLRLEHATASALAGADGLDAGALAVLRILCEAQDWVFARFWIADDARGVLRVVAHWSLPGMAPPEPPEGLARLVLHKGEGLAGHVWASGEPLWVPDLRAEPRVVQKGLVQSDVVASASLLPVVSGGQVFGVLALRARGARVPDGRQQASVQAICQQLGQFARTKLGERRVQRLHRVSSVLSDINSLIVRATDRDELFAEACRIAVETGRFRKAWIGMLSHTPWRLQAIMAAVSDVPLSAEALLSIREAMQQQLQGGGVRLEQLLEHGQPIFENDIAASDWPGVRERALSAGSRSLAILPLVVERQAVGLVVLHSLEVGFFDDEECQLLLELAGNLAFAMEHLQRAEQINRLAYYDVLTGQANGMLFRERLAQHLHAAAERQTLVLAMVDIERFKSINDSLGRHVGDEVLRQVGARMAQLLRGASHMARVGSDQFAVLFDEELAEIEVARMLQDFYRQCFSDPVVASGVELRVSGRIGVARFPMDGDSAEALYHNAEAAMKRSKTSMDQVLFYDARMTEVIAAKLALENRLRRALQASEFTLHYQPKVDCVARRTVGLEALIRWNDPERGLVSPGDFIPLMEETGLIVEVGAWALRQALADRRSWQAQGMHPPRVAVNVSAIQLQRAEFLGMVRTLLAQEPGEPGIDLEITESAVLQQVDKTVQTLHDLRALGLDIAIDDFGTGYSSLSYLARLPVQVLKIDQSFVSAMASDADAQTLVDTMISLAHALRMKVVAEGVETEEQAALLKILRCDVMQGYLISRPLAGEALLQWLQRQSGHPQGAVRQGP